MITLRRLIPALGLAALVLAAHARADVVVANPGAPTVGSGNRAFAASWTQLADYTDVSISAAVFGQDVAGVSASAWLTTSIGLGASEADVVASTSITSGTLFQGLDLAADTYYLVLMFDSGAVAAGWRGNDGSQMTSAADVLVGPSYAGPFLSFPTFGPSADFAERPGQFIYAVDGTPVAAVPEPASLVLLATGLSGLWVARRRRPATRRG